MKALCYVGDFEQVELQDGAGRWVTATRGGEPLELDDSIAESLAGQVGQWEPVGWAVPAEPPADDPPAVDPPAPPAKRTARRSGSTKEGGA